MSVVSWRTRCLRVVFSVVMRWMDSFGPLGFQVPDLAEELADPGALLDDLGVGGLQGVFGVEGAFPPGRLLPGVLSGPVLRLAGGRWPRWRRPPRFWLRGCCRERCGRRPPAG